MTVTVERGTYKIIRVDGSETMVSEKPTISKITRAIGCGCIDTVILDRRARVVMIVDDTGMVDGKPVNPKATELYHGICRPGTVFSIHGDVAICHDGDFA